MNKKVFSLFLLITLAVFSACSSSNLQAILTEDNGKWNMEFTEEPDKSKEIEFLTTGKVHILDGVHKAKLSYEIDENKSEIKIKKKKKNIIKFTDVKVVDKNTIEATLKQDGLDETEKVKLIRID